MHNSISSLFVNIDGSEGSAHSYIIEGRAGEAREQFLKDFIKGLNCQAENPADRPCCACPSCRQIEAGTSMDIYHMSMSGKTGYKVVDAEPFIERMNMGAYGRHNIGIIDDADLLSEVIQNKLLKTLEEPEPETVIILVSGNRDNLISTVRSRCIVIRTNDYVEDIDAEDSAKLVEIAELIAPGEKTYFYELRNAIEKKIKSKEEAIAILGIIEDNCRENMIKGISTGDMAVAIEIIEMTRMDIYRGMQYSKALKKMILELA